VDVEHLPQRLLVAASQVPRHWYPQLTRGLKYQTVALRQLIGREPTAQWIVDVRVGAGLVQHDVTVLHACDKRWDPHQKLLRLCRPVVLLGRAVVDHEVDAQRRNDLLGSIAVVLVQVQDGNALRQSFGFQCERGDHQAVESAERIGFGVSRMMKPADRRHRHQAIAEGLAGRCQHRATGVGQRRGDVGGSRVEPVHRATIHDCVNVLTVVRAS